MLITRLYTADDLPLLKAMFYQSLYVRKGQAPFPEEIIEQANLKKYWVNFGQRDNDLCLIGIKDGIPIGAIWARFFSPDAGNYGFVRADYPEIGMALQKGFRGQGLGTELMQIFLAHCQQLGFTGVSLSVDQENIPALRLYEKMNFTKVNDEGTAFTMYKSLPKP